MRASLLLLAVLAAGAHAQQRQPAGAPIAWETLAAARPAAGEKKLSVQFPAQLVAVDGRNVTLRGFMVPLEAKPAQVHFLLTATPQDCEFCIEGGPTRYVEVKSDVPLKYSSQPLVLVGRLDLLRNDPSGVYYRLSAARPVPER